MGKPNCKEPYVTPLTSLVSSLDDDDERAAIAAAYRLALYGEQAAAPLLEALCGDNIRRRTMAAYGFGPLGVAAVPALIEALDNSTAAVQTRIVDVIGDIGPRARAALPYLQQLATSDDVPLRRYAIEAIGLVAQDENQVPAELVTGLNDEDDLSRRNAALAVARSGEKAAGLPGLVEALAANLYHSHHHVRGWSLEALQRLGNPTASQIAVKYLQAARWDYNPRSGDRVK